MTRPRRIYFERAVYHVCIRGNNKQEILKEADDKNIFLKTLAKFKKRFGFKLYGFVIMPNHAHLIMEAPVKTNISKIMQAIMLSYSVKFRKKYVYTGHVWQERFRSNVIDDDTYILNCINYVHNNPVRASLSETPKKYPWSSYHFYEGLQSPVNNIIEVDFYRDTSSRTPYPAIG